jgi:CoA:oxalate CoA-transferase
MLLAGLGADVIKVERPRVGDIARSSPPFVNGVSLYFASLNRGKKSLSLNLATETGKELFLNLTRHADVVVECFTPGTMSRLGLSYEVIRNYNPRIIYAAGSGFGQYGPYAHKPALDVVIQAMSGVMSITGEPDGPPVRPGVSYGDIVAGLFLCIGILAALEERHKSGEGQMIDIAMLDCQLTVLENALARYLNTGEIPKAQGTKHPTFAPFQVFPTKDGYIAIALKDGTEDQWPLFCAIIEKTDLIEDERFANGWSRRQNYDILEPLLVEALRSKTTAEWLIEFARADIPCGPLNSIPDVVKDPQVIERQMIVEVEHPIAGRLRLVNVPFKFSRSASGLGDRVPELGEHTEEILTSVLGLSASEVVVLRQQGIV